MSWRKRGERTGVPLISQRINVVSLCLLTHTTTSSPPPNPPTPADAQAIGSTLARLNNSTPGTETVFVNFNIFWKMCVDMLRRGAGYEFKGLEIVPPGKDLRKMQSITDRVDVALLPKAIGGDAVFVDKEGKEDDTCGRCWGDEADLPLSQILRGIDGGLD